MTGYTLADVVPWGRSLAEYEHMFSLTPTWLAGRIFGCGDGPASFNAEATAGGATVVSGDPLYRFDADAIARRVDDVFDEVMGQTRLNQGEFVWGGVIADLDDLARQRRTAMDRFLADYPQGRAAGRYVDCELPSLPFVDGQFDLALCSHFLFLYSVQRSLEFHLQSILELTRIATEVRVFPLLELGSRPSRHLAPVLAALAQRPELTATVDPVDYEFQRGGNQMLRIVVAPR